MILLDTNVLSELMRRQPEEALSFIDKALEIQPDYTAAKHDLALALRMREQQRAAQSDKA